MKNGVILYYYYYDILGVSIVYCKKNYIILNEGIISGEVSRFFASNAKINDFDSTVKITTVLF